VELRPQCRLDAVSGLVAGPETIAERFDDVVCGNADVRGAGFDRLQHRVQHTGDRAEGRVVAFGEARR
jgi:hypothetical protein